MPSRYVVVGALVLGVAALLLYRSKSRDSGRSSSAEVGPEKSASQTSGDRRPDRPGLVPEPGERSESATPNDRAGSAAKPGPAPDLGPGSAKSGEPVDREPLPPRPQLTPEEERAKKIRYLVTARRTVQHLKKQGGAKAASALAENQKVLTELERWAKEQSITEEELARANKEIESQRAQEAQESRRPR